LPEGWFSAEVSTAAHLMLEHEALVQYSQCSLKCCCVALFQDAESGDLYYYTADGRTIWDRPQSSPTTEVAQTPALLHASAEEVAASDSEQVQDVVLTRKPKAAANNDQQQQQPQQRQRRGSLDALKEQLQQAEQETANKEHERALAEVC
jgi:hypothetical protein